mgnify:CR=1 FL=1
MLIGIDVRSPTCLHEVTTEFSINIDRIGNRFPFGDSRDLARSDQSNGRIPILARGALRTEFTELIHRSVARGEVREIINDRIAAERDSVTAAVAIDQDLTEIIDRQK